MTSSESNNRNASQADGIRIEITRPHPLLFPTSVYSIPPKESKVYVPIRLYVNVINDSSTPFYITPFQSFSPEVVTLDGQIIKPNLVSEEIVTNVQSNKTLEYSQRQEVGWWQIKPESSFGFRLIAKLFWQNNSLQLKIPSPANYVSGSTNLNYFWCFDDLQANTYQLRFILNTEFSTRYTSKSNIINEQILLEDSSKILTTTWVNLRLVHPLSTDSDAIEVDDLRFKVEKSSSVLWTTPTMQSGAKREVKIGIRVTNNTSKAFRFYQTGSFDVIVIDNYGKTINFVSDPIRLQLSHDPKYYLVYPGEDTFFDLKGMLFWADDQLQLAIPNKCRHCFTGADTFYYFHHLKLGNSYHLQFIYYVSELRAKRLQENVDEIVWNGWIFMPYIEFCLIEP